MLRQICVAIVGSALIAQAEIAQEIPWGIEVVTGYRTDLVERGFKLGEDTLDVQIESEYILNNQWSLAFGAFHATASGKATYQETRSFLDVIHEHESLSYGWQLGYRDVQSNIWQSGIETGPFVQYDFNENLSAGLELLYDGGADGCYTQAHCSWSKLLSEKSYLSLDGTAGYATDYYGRDGFHDISARFGYTYNLATNVSITPFIGASLGIHDQAADQMFAGIWFAVTF